MTAASSVGDVIDRFIDERFDAAVSLLQSLVRERSVLGQVNGAQQLLARALRQMGLVVSFEDVSRDDVIRDERYAPVAWSADGQKNVIGLLPATIDAGDQRPIVLNGHIDVVPADPEAWWTYDPWGGEISGGRMYGRGALDMKSGIVAAMLAAEALAETGVPRRFPIVIESVIEEECTGNGMLARRLACGPVRGAIIMEPTELALWTATPGVLWFEVCVHGKPAYVGRASELVNAVETAAALIGRLKPQAVAALNDAFNDPRFAQFERPLTLNVGKIEGGVWPSSVPLECRFTCRMSYPIAWSAEQAMVFVQEQVQAAAAVDPWLAKHAPAVTFSGFRASPWETVTEGGLHQAIDAAHRDIMGTSITRSVFPGTADARYFSAGEEVLYYGPTGGNIHAPDEFVDLESVKQTARVLARVLLEMQAES